MKERLYHIMRMPSIRALAASLALTSFAPGVASAAVPLPQVMGPIPWTGTPGNRAHNYTFFATDINLKTYGYVEQEFFFTGKANRYNITVNGAPGPNPTAIVQDTDHPYKSRMVVRRPASQSHFNGTVIVEWMNVSPGFDNESDWFQAHDFWLRAGYAWVGVSAQHVGIDNPVTGLKAWSPTRYGSLDVTQGGKFTQDELSWDIYSQAIEAIRESGSRTRDNWTHAQLMGGLHVQRVIATGHSQSASYLGYYVNAIQPLAHELNGAVLRGGGQKIRTDLDIPVFKGQSETEPALFGIDSLFQPDTDKLRTWQVAGASHLDRYFYTNIDPLAIRDFGADSFNSQIPLCAGPSLSRIPFRYVDYTIYRDMSQWIEQHIAPPHAPLIDVASFGPPVQLARNNLGIAQGGIQLSEAANPIAQNTGVNSGPGFCFLFGTYKPFTSAQLKKLYPSHAVYVAKVTEETLRNLRAGYIMVPEALQTIQDAINAAVP